MPRSSSVAVLALVLGVAGCSPRLTPTVTPTPTVRPSSAAPSASSRPTSPAVPGLTWVTADDVARPDDAFTGGSAPTTGPAGPGTAGHPGHFRGQAIVDDVVAAPAGGLVAVGYVGVRGVWTAIAWQSSDGRSWSLSPIDHSSGSLALSVTAGDDGMGGEQIVAAGIVGREPAAWTSSDGRAWLRHPVPTLSSGAEAERIAVIATVDGGYLAGGSVGPELGERHARFWRSADGATWDPVPDDPGFDGAEVVAIARLDPGYVAVGRLGTGQRGTGSVAWTSPDGRHWSRVAAPSLAGVLVAGLAEGPDGGLVAVGSDLDEREALAWLSPDGRDWEAVPREPSRIYNDGDKIRMTDVVAVPGGLVAVGNFVAVQFGTATSWISPDGRSWRRASPDAVLQQGEMLAVARGGRGLVAVGSFGAPDNYIPTVWLSELAGGR